MNSGIGNLIGSVSYELASDEACRTKAQHEARPSPSEPTHTSARQASTRPSARPGPAKALGAPARAQQWAERCAPSVGRKACAGVRCSCIACAGILKQSGFEV